MYTYYWLLIITGYYYCFHDGHCHWPLLHTLLSAALDYQSLYFTVDYAGYWWLLLRYASLILAIDISAIRCRLWCHAASLIDVAIILPARSLASFFHWLLPHWYCHAITIAGHYNITTHYTHAITIVIFITSLILAINIVCRCHWPLPAIASWCWCWHIIFAISCWLATHIIFHWYAIADACQLRHWLFSHTFLYAISALIIISLYYASADAIKGHIITRLPHSHMPCHYSYYW